MSTNDKELEAVWREIRQWFADKDDALVAARLILAARIKEGFDASYIAQLKQERDEALSRVKEWEEGVRGTALRDHREWIANLEESSRYWQAEAERWRARVQDLAPYEHEVGVVHRYNSELAEHIAQLEAELKAETDEAEGYQKALHVAWAEGAENARLREAFEKADEESDYKSGPEFRLRQRLRAALRNDGGAK